MPNVYSKKDAAKALNISVETLDRYKKLGKVPYHQIGDRVVFTENDLVAFLENCAVPSTTLPTSLGKQEMAKAVGME
jgi:predicted site-specific integrase-resolvase